MVPLANLKGQDQGQHCIILDQFTVVLVQDIVILFQAIVILDPWSKIGTSKDNK